jgi:dienelactone hydrolase
MAPCAPIFIGAALSLAGCSSKAMDPGQESPTAGTEAGAGESGGDGSTTGPAAPDSLDASRASDAGAAESDGAMPFGLRCQADASSPQTIDYSQPGPYAVGKMDITFDDTSRPIAATSSHPAAPSRTLVTTIYYPASDSAPLVGQAPLAKGGPFPMLMYAHGYSSSRSEAGPLANRAASYGYVVVAPDFPLSNLSASGGPDPSDAVNQPGDLSFLIDQLLTISRDSQHVLWKAVDESRIGAVGVSMGGLTTLLVGFHPRLKDDRVKVVAPIAPLSSFFMQGFYHTRELPMLLIQGDLDAFLNYQRNGRRSFERAAPNARLVTLAHGTHAAFAVQFDPGTIAALNALLGPPHSDPTNSDGFGCGGVGSRLADSGAAVTALGGTADFIDYDPVNDSIAPCTGDEYTHPAMDPKLQVELAVRGAMAFFESVLGNTQDVRNQGCRYLLYELPKDPAVTLE